MKIQQSPISPVSPPSPSSSSTSSYFSSSSSIHSSTSSHSLSTATTTASPLRRRCKGLDLLVKAVYHVAGSVIGVPYIQRRVIRRRKPAIRFSKLLFTSNDHAQIDNPHVQDDDDDDEMNCNGNGDGDGDGDGDGELIVVGKVKKQRRRSKVVPLKYQDSVLQSLKPKDRKRRRSSKT